MTPKEYKLLALCGHLNINRFKVHNINHEEIAERILATHCHIDILNIWTKEDLKCILHYMRKYHHEKVKKRSE